MNTSGEAADQVVRMSLEVGEAALKISGEGAKQLAVILYAILKEQKKTKGRARLETLVRSGKPLTVFSVKESDLKKFVQEAKRYGILYCAVRDPKGSSDGMVDIMVKEEDAPRINRIVERFQFASVSEAAQIRTEIEKSREEKSQRTDTKENPSLAKTGKSPLSERISGKSGGAVRGTFEPSVPDVAEKPSVRGQLREIEAARKKEAAAKKPEGILRDAGPGNRNRRQRRPQTKRKTQKPKVR